MMFNMVLKFQATIANADTGANANRIDTVNTLVDTLSVWLKALVNTQMIAGTTIHSEMI